MTAPGLLKDSEFPDCCRQLRPILFFLCYCCYKTQKSLLRLPPCAQLTMKTLWGALAAEKGKGRKSLCEFIIKNKLFPKVGQGTSPDAKMWSFLTSVERPGTVTYPHSHISFSTASSTILEYVTHCILSLIDRWSIVDSPSIHRWSNIGTSLI